MAAKALLPAAGWAARLSARGPRIGARLFAAASGGPAQADKAMASKLKDQGPEQKFEKLSQIDHALNRPGMYVGSTSLVTQPRWVVSSLDPLAMESATVPFLPALVKMFDELLVNACDNVVRDPKGTTRIEAAYDGRVFSVFNNGKGIPVVKHAQEKIYIPHLVFGEMLSGSNFSRTDETTGGRHGLGAKLCNVFSTWFKVETCDGKHLFEMEWFDNMKRKSDARVQRCPPEQAGQFTKVSFVPDWTRFQTGKMDLGSLRVMETRVVETAALHPKVAVSWNGKLISLDFERFCRLLLPRDTPVVHMAPKKNWEVCVAANGTGDALLHASFVNGVATVRGGTHVDWMADLVAEPIREACAGQLGKGTKLSIADVKKHLALFVSCRVPDADFEGQTKDSLLTKPQDLDAPEKLTEAVRRSIVKDAGVVASVLESLSEKADRALRRASSKSKLLSVKKLDDAAGAGKSDRADRCTLILTEGDSAKALAVAGVASLKERDLYGVFPLRGKPLNVRDVSKSAIASNVEMTSVMRILGLEEGKNYPTDPKIPTGLRYGRVMIMTDQDHDGAHIKGLLINLFHELWPSLLQRKGFLCQFRTPLLKAKRKGQSDWSLEFFSQAEFEKWRRETADASSWTVKWYKGLGTSTAQEAKKYFANLPRHVVEFTTSPEDDDAIDMAFSKSRALDRKAWLSEHSSESDVMAQTLTSRKPTTLSPLLASTEHQSYAAFVHSDLVQYSWHDVERSIPSALDGLKPSQRKVLHACFTRSAKRGVAETDEVKVVQLAGYVAETTAYHHGETSLHNTIIGMAQDFVGSNNAPLLVAAGQFGTRAEGGLDAAAPRYIFTRLHANARLFFPKDDDDLLERRLEDGEPVEPKVFLPVVPTVLVNGAVGIGTGWSCYVPPHHPGDVALSVAALLDNRAPSKLQPWFCGFTGPVYVDDATGTITTEGVAKVLPKSKNTVVVTELPIGLWNEAFKEKMEELLDNTARIIDKHNGSQQGLCFEVASSKLEELLSTNQPPVKALKLRSVFKTTNMHLLDAKERIRRYETVEEILREFMPLRLELYRRRHKTEVDRLDHEAASLVCEASAVRLLADGRVSALGRSRADLLAALGGLGVAEPMAKRVIERAVGDLTVDRVKALEDKARRAGELANEAKKQTPEGRWKRDLDRIVDMWGQSAKSR